MDGKTSVAIPDQTFFDNASHLQDAAPCDMARTLLEQFRSVSDGWRSFEGPRSGGALLDSQWFLVGSTGASRQVSSNGKIIETRKNGMEIHLYPEDRITISWPDGSTGDVEPSFPARGLRSTNVDDDGNVTFIYGDRTREKNFRSGFQTIDFPDGSGYLREQNGRTHVWHANRESEHYDEHGLLERRWTVEQDGARVSTDGSGRVEMRQCPDGRIREFSYGPDGELAEIVGHLGQWKRDAGRNGKTAWVNQNSGKVWDGDFNVDPHGNARYVPHKGHGLCAAEALAFPRSRN